MIEDPFSPDLAVITPGFERPPYHVESFPSGWHCVCNRDGFNCLSFTHKPGAVFTTLEAATEIAKRWNEQVVTLLQSPVACVALVETLSKREREVLAQVIQDGASKIAARTLGVSFQTVDFHLARIRVKLRVKSTAQATAIFGAAMVGRS